LGTECEVHHLKGRHLTATGGLSRNDKNRVLDLIAKADALEDDSKLVNARIADLKRNLIEFMKRR
jgi:hypothetical protein